MMILISEHFSIYLFIPPKFRTNIYFFQILLIVRNKIVIYFRFCSKVFYFKYLWENFIINQTCKAKKVTTILNMPNVEYMRYIPRRGEYFPEMKLPNSSFIREQFNFF